MIDLKLHHIGVATKSIEMELPFFENLGYKRVSEVFVDEGQKIKGLFIAAENQPTLELLENMTPDGPLNGCLAKGIKFYHFAYETHDIDKDAERIKQIGAMVIVPVVNAVYFDKVCFLMLKNMMMIELVQLRGKNDK